MELFGFEDLGLGAGHRSPSRASTTSSTTLMIHTPASSETTGSGANPEPARPSMAAPVPSGPLWVSSLSTTSWRPQYPHIGQFAMTSSEEVIAATPDGLVSFKRVQDHPSKPWSKARPFPTVIGARLDAWTVTGLALHQGEKDTLHVYCVADGRMHAFSRSGHLGATFDVDSCPAFAGSKVSGTPAVTSIKEELYDLKWCVVVPSQYGGILYTSTNPPSKSCRHSAPKQGWEPANQVAAYLGIISAVSVAAVTHAKKPTSCSHRLETYSHRLETYSHRLETNTDIVAVCIASSHLHSIEGPFEETYIRRANSWQGGSSFRIHHPGEVTGNPVLISSENREKYGTRDWQLDLLVPSTEGGIFHFIRTVKTPNEWHMIGRISFPTGVPIVSSLACVRLGDSDGFAPAPKFRALVQCGGRLYLIKTTECAAPWTGSQLYPIEGPGPFLH